jgi:hypothetical protein
MNDILHMLSIGALDPRHLAYNIYLQQHRCAIVTAAGHRELCGSTRISEPCRVAILHDTLHLRDLIESSQYIRRLWPDAKILIVRSEVWCIDDHLYDDRITPGVNPEILLAAVDRLDGRRRVCKISESREGNAFLERFAGRNPSSEEVRSLFDEISQTSA